jgi:hypothetical protein
MKVSSPVGDLPFEVMRWRWKQRTIVLEGAMGAWPARIVIYPHDAPKLLRLFRGPLVALAVIIFALLIVLSIY